MGAPVYSITEDEDSRFYRSYWDHQRELGAVYTAVTTSVKNLIGPFHRS